MDCAGANASAGRNTSAFRRRRRTGDVGSPEHERAKNFDDILCALKIWSGA